MLKVARANTGMLRSILKSSIGKIDGSAAFNDGIEFRGKVLD